MPEIPEEWKKWYEKMYAEKKEAKIALAPEFREKLVNIGKIIPFVILINIFIISNVINISGIVDISKTKELVYSIKDLTSPPSLKINVSLKISSSGIEINSTNISTGLIALNMKINNKYTETQPDCINDTCKIYSECPESISLPFIPYDIDITYIINSEVPVTVNNIEKTGEIQINKVPNKMQLEWQEAGFKC